MALLGRLASADEGRRWRWPRRWEGSPGRSPLAGLAFVTSVDPGEAAWVPGELLDDDGVRGAARRRWWRPAAARSTPTGPRPSTAGCSASASTCGTLDIDTEVACYLLDPAESAYLLQELPAALRRPRAGRRRARAAAEGRLDLDGRPPSLPEETGRFAVAVARLAPVVTDALAAQGLRDLYDSVERPLVRVLARMEAVGVAVDVPYLKALNERLAAEAVELEQRIQEEAGVEFKVNSTPQLRTVLFDKLGLAPSKRTKTGFSTDAASLEKLRGQHPIIELLLRYREVEKLRSTYGDGLVTEVGPDGRIHATFNQTVARTGRLSSDQPNLHNIPVRTEEGRRFRRAFIAGEGFELLVADYNQIELRVIAHLAEDPGLIAAFTAGEDIHNATASRVFGVDPEEVTLGPAGPLEDGLLRPGLRHGGLRAGAAAEHRRARGGPRSSTPTSTPSRTCGPTWSAPWPRPGRRATPRRSWAGAGPSPSSPRPTSASARRGSARP